MLPEDRLIELRTALLRINCRVLQLTAAVDHLADTLHADGEPRSAMTTSTPVDTTQAERARNFQHNTVIYAQRRAARRGLTQAIRAGALIPRDALGFMIEQYPSSDKDRDTLCLRPAPPVDSEEDSETTTPDPETTTPEEPTSATTTPETPTAVIGVFSDPYRPISARTSRQRNREFHVTTDHKTAQTQARSWFESRQRRRRVSRNTRVAKATKSEKK
eukprot:scaffold4410_cov44-Attheya_sp.AAC.5